MDVHFTCNINALGDTLYPKVRVRRTYVRKIGPRRQRKQRAPRRVVQSSSGYVNVDTVMRGVNLIKRGVNTNLVKMMIDGAVSLIPLAYNSLKNRIFGRKKEKQQHRVIIRQVISHRWVNIITKLL